MIDYVWTCRRLSWSAAMTNRRPSWQLDDCPAWCVVDHREDDHPDDRVHRTDAPSVPVIARSRRFDPDLTFEVDAADFEVGVSRRDGDVETWIYVGGGSGQQIEITRESAARLVRALNIQFRISGENGAE
jgi:hypothetical protein